MPEHQQALCQSCNHPVFQQDEQMFATAAIFASGVIRHSAAQSANLSVRRVLSSGPRDHGSRAAARSYIGGTFLRRQ
jgi:hypothetical protein